MKILDLIILDTAIIITPLLIYLLYTAYIKVVDKKEEKLIFLITIFMQMYLIYKYSIPINKHIPLLIVDIPLLISFYKKNNILSILISIVNIIYYNFFYEYHLIILVMEYIIYFWISINEKDTKKQIFLFWITKFIFLTYYININIYLLVEIIIILLFSFFTLYLLKKSEEIINIHAKIKKIEKEKQVQLSLFKITHEIKNPIAVCKGYLDMYDEKDIEKAKKYIPIIKDEINRVLILLEDFLSMNKQKLNKEIIDINMLIEDVLKNMNLLFKNKKIKIESTISEDETYVNADYNRLTQVLINILKNSVEALEKTKKPKITIWTKQTKDKIIIHILDNGEGMKKETLEKIKEPFYTTKQKGTGLGVSLSNEIIKAHKGQLKYNSKENKYTEVIIKLPLEKAI